MCVFLFGTDWTSNYVFLFVSDTTTVYKFIVVYLRTFRYICLCISVRVCAFCGTPTHRRARVRLRTAYSDST